MWFIFRYIILPVSSDIVWGIGLERAYGIEQGWWIFPLPFIISFFPMGWLLNLIVFSAGVTNLLVENGFI